MSALESYRAAQLRARIRQGQLDERSALAIRRALEDYARRLQAGIESLPPGRRDAADLSARIIRDAAAALEQSLQSSTGAIRTVSFETTYELWQKAGAEAAAALNIPGALLGAVKLPSLSMMGAFEGVGASSWRTLLRGHATNAAGEAQQIVRLALLEGADPTELARRLRRYVTGAEPFEKLFESVPTRTGDVMKIDLRKLTAEQRGAAFRMEYNARRIAFTETHNARAEAEIQHFGADPLVQAVRWTLAPDRGSAKVPDQCDVLATADYYGLGRGVFPVLKVPPSPHPFDRCERMPVTRSVAQVGEPKPNPDRVLDYEQAPIPGASRLTPDQAARVREAAARSVRFGEEVAATAAAAAERTAVPVQKAVGAATVAPVALAPQQQPKATPARPKASAPKFEPARTVSLAERAAREAGLANTISYKGLSLDVANEVNQTLMFARQRWGLQSLEALGASDLRSGANAFFGISRGKPGIMVNPAAMKSTSGFARTLKAAANEPRYKAFRAPKVQAALKSAEDAAADLAQVDAWAARKGVAAGSAEYRAELVRRDLALMKAEAALEELTASTGATAARWSVTENVGDTIRHEVAHALHYQKARETMEMAGEITDAAALARRSELFERYGIDRWMSDPAHRLARMRISEYAGSELDEYIAESFAAWAKGIEIHPDVKRFIEEVLVK